MVGGGSDVGDGRKVARRGLFFGFWYQASTRIFVCAGVVGGRAGIVAAGGMPSGVRCRIRAAGGGSGVDGGLKPALRLGIKKGARRLLLRLVTVVNTSITGSAQC